MSDLLPPINNFIPMPKGAKIPPPPPGILTHRYILQLIQQGVIYYPPELTDATPLEELVNGTSMDVTFANEVMVESGQFGLLDVFILGEKPPSMVHQVVGDNQMLFPGAFILAKTQQMFNLPLNISADFRLKSSVARSGLEHLMAGWCDPGWHGSALTLELKNALERNVIRIRPGTRIGQLVFYAHDPVSEEVSYRKLGRYNNTPDVTGVKIASK